MFNRTLFLVCSTFALLAGAPEALAQAGLDFANVPYELPSGRLTNFQPFSGYPIPAQQTVVLPLRFFAGLSEHPRPPLADRTRQAIGQLEKQPGQYIECKLANGQVLVGTVSYTTPDGFELKTGAIRAHRVKYSDLGSMPLPVNAPGHKFLRGLEIGGMVVVAIVAIPILVPILTLACAAGDCPC
jgi:hypothetical protein